MTVAMPEIEIIIVSSLFATALAQMLPGHFRRMDGRLEGLEAAGVMIATGCTLGRRGRRCRRRLAAEDADDNGNDDLGDVTQRRQESLPVNRRRRRAAMLLGRRQRHAGRSERRFGLGVEGL